MWHIKKAGFCQIWATPNHKNGSLRKQEADIQRMHSPIKINEAFLWSATISGCALANPLLQMISLFKDCIGWATPRTRGLFIPWVSENLQQTSGGQRSAHWHWIQATLVARRWPGGCGSFQRVWCRTKAFPFIHFDKSVFVCQNWTLQPGSIKAGSDDWILVWKSY